jgi:DNA polymerase III subunit gamma/tau
VDQPKEEKETVQDILDDVCENLPIKIDDLKKYWADYIAERKIANKPYEIVILNQDFTFNSNLITLKLSNPVQLDQLNGFKLELLSFLRKKLQNYLLDIEAIISVEEEKKIVYTSTDKFNFLAQKNPALLELKQKLGLDIDY